MRKDVQHATPCEKTCKNHAKSCHAKSCHAKTMPKPCKKQAVPHVAKNKLFHMSCKNHAKTMQHAVRTLASTPGKWRGREATQGAAGRLRRARQPAEHPLPPGSMLYVLYVLYLTRQATEHPPSPGSMLYVLYVLYLTRQATEHPLPPGSMLYVLYVLYGPI